MALSKQWSVNRSLTLWIVDTEYWIVVLDSGDSIWCPALSGKPWGGWKKIKTSYDKLSWLVILSPCHLVTLSPCYFVTLSFSSIFIKDCSISRFRSRVLGVGGFCRLENLWLFEVLWGKDIFQLLVIPSEARNLAFEARFLARNEKFMWPHNSSESQTFSLRNWAFMLPSFSLGEFR